jgi:hypothetical protein
MELTEPIENINNQLLDLFGIDTISGEPIWRVVFSEEQFEKRHGTYDDYTPNGLFIRTVTEVREVPKYRQWVQEKYVLERLVVIPAIDMPELPVTKTSYEPIFVFQDGNDNYLPPKLEIAKFVIDSIYSAQYGTKNLARYKDSETDNETHIEMKKKRVDDIIEYLYGDESGLMGTTLTGESVIVPRNFEKRES